MKVKKKKCSECGELKVIWKNDGGERYCKYCWMRKSATVKQNKPTKRYKIPHRSPQRAKEERLYLKLNREFLIEHSSCQAQIPGLCTYQSSEVHHKKGRVGKLLTDVTNFLAVCHNCHEWIENHTIEAQELGFSINKIK